MHFPPNRIFRIPIQLALAGALLTVAMTGCKSKQDAALEQAKKQAASTGQAQQIVTTDKDGNTVTTTVQPPQPGQNGQVVTTTVTPKGTTASGAQDAQAGAQPGTQPATGQAAATPQPATPQPPPPPPPINVAAGTSLAI